MLLYWCTFVGEQLNYEIASQLNIPAVPGLNSFQHEVIFKKLSSSSDRCWAKLVKFCPEVVVLWLTLLWHTHTHAHAHIYILYISEGKSAPTAVTSTLFFRDATLWWVKRRYCVKTLLHGTDLIHMMSVNSSTSGIYLVFFLRGLVIIYVFCVLCLLRSINMNHLSSDCLPLVIPHLNSSPGWNKPYFFSM